MPPRSSLKFHSETPRKVKTSSVPRNVRGFDASSLKASFHSELGHSIFDEDAIPTNIYDGDIIADCWFPDNILPLVPDDELLNTLVGPDGQPLYASSTKQWDSRHLPPILHKVAEPQIRPRLGVEQEERELSAFMTTVMDALIRHRDKLPSNTDNAATPAPGPYIPFHTGTAAASPSDPDSLDSDPFLLPVTSTSSPGPLPSFPTRSAARPHPRLWSSAAAARPLAGGMAPFKPDSVLVRRPADGTTGGLEWSDVLMTAELTSRQATLDLTSQIECKMLAMFDAQPDRAFSYSLSFHADKYRLYMYDRAGGVYSRSYDLHESPHALLRILCAATFAPISWLGMDDTFDSRLHPVITVDDAQYSVIAKCFSSNVIRGRATTVWFVSQLGRPVDDPSNVFVIKDSWVNMERQQSEEDILEALKDVECVPKIEKAWTVQRNNQDDSTSLRRPGTFMSHFKWRCDHRVRRRLVLTPAGRPITYAASPLEVITCLLDVIIAHKQIWLLGILHRDISINNVMMYEEILPDGRVRVRGLLIDFDYAVKVDGSARMAGPGDRTGTVPFMAIELLRADEQNPVRHNAGHDLESFVYLLCWIAALYAGPQSKFRQDSAKLALDGWYEGDDLATLANNKEGCMSSASHLDNITPYYSSLYTCISALSDLVAEQLRAQRNARSSLAPHVSYLTGSKRPRSEDDETLEDPLNHDAVITILLRTCFFLRGGQMPEPGEPLPSYHLTRDRSPLGPYLLHARTQIADLGGGSYVKKRRILRRIHGPMRTAVV